MTPMTHVLIQMPYVPLHESERALPQAALPLIHFNLKATQGTMHPPLSA